MIHDPANPVLIRTLTESSTAGQEEAGRKTTGYRAGVNDCAEWKSTMKTTMKTIMKANKK